MLKWFNCPAGQVVVSDCLARCERQQGRCLSLPTLYACGEQRTWTGTPSTTMLLNGTRMEYLKITTDWTIRPDDRAFAVLGTSHHKRLEDVAKKLSLIAEKQLGGEVTGILDLLEPDADKPGYWRLFDYKTWGSYAVRKALGGKGKAPDLGQSLLQLNNYRLKVEALGFPVSDMFIQATVRDGNTRTSQSYDLPKRFYLIPVRKLPDDQVTTYFNRKRAALTNALGNKMTPPICSTEERWGGRRCTKYCEVLVACAPAGKPSYQGGSYAR